MIHALLLAPALFAVQADPWADAVGQLETKLKAQPGIGAVVLAERLDGRTVRLRVKSIGAGFKQVEAQAREVGGAYDIKASTPQMMDAFDTTTVLPAEATTLTVFISGEMFSPKVLVPITKHGGPAQPAFILMGVRTK